MNIFPGLATKAENADVFASAEFSPSTSDSMNVSIQFDTTLMTDKVNGRYQVMGSNISGNVADMVAVKDESGSSAAVAVTVPFVKQFFPYKYIGIQYTHLTNAGAGTFNVTIVKKVTRTNLV